MMTFYMHIAQIIPSLELHDLQSYCLAIGDYVKGIFITWGTWDKDVKDGGYIDHRSDPYCIASIFMLFFYLVLRK